MLSKMLVQEIQDLKDGGYALGEVIQHLKKRYGAPLKEFGDKVSAEDKAPIENAMNDLKEALKSDNTDDIKAKTEALQNAFYALSSKVYSQVNPNGGAPDFSNMDMSSFPSGGSFPGGGSGFPGGGSRGN